MGHLNDLQDEFGERGLTVLAVTNEGAKPTERFVESTRMAYPYAYDKKSALMRAMGVGPIPHAVLVDPSGTIVWRA